VNVLAIGSHPDDIELGCAGALARHAAAGHHVTLLVMTTGERGPGVTELRVREQEAAARVLGAKLLWADFADCEIPSGPDVVGLIEDVVRSVRADVLYTHAPHDTHQDHVVTATASLAAARRLPRVLCYQGPTTTTFEPTMYVDIDDTISTKLAALGAHASQVQNCELVDLDAVEAGGRFWGHRARMRYAEPFETPRFAWDLGVPVQEQPATEEHEDATVTQLRPVRNRLIAVSE
jgi:LmbE family N-acetylglucosaminyl deacetylase